MRTLARLAVVVVTGFLATGCRTDQTLWDDERKELDTADGKDGSLATDRAFLGVCVPARAPNDVTLGVRVERVLRDSPADRAQIRPGDEIRSVNGVLVRTARDLDSAVRSAPFLRGGWDLLDHKLTPPRMGEEEIKAATAELVVFSGLDERKVHVTLESAHWRESFVRGRLEDSARSNDATFAIPIAFYYENMTVPADVYRDYTGVEVINPAVTFYEEVAIVCLAPLALFRTEHSLFHGAWRLTIGIPIYTSTSDDEQAEAAPGESVLVVY